MLVVAAVAVTAMPGQARARTLDDCRPLRALFYASTGSLGLAQALAANASPCAQYYVSVPPLAADKTQMRRARPARSGRSDQHPRPRGGERHGLAGLGHERRKLLVPGRGGGTEKDGRRRLRRRGGRHLGRERALIRRPRRLRHEPAGHARPRARTLRRRRRASGEGRCLRHRYRPADGLARHVQGPARVVAAGRGVLGRHERVRQRLPSGGLRRCPRLRRPRLRRANAPRLPERLPRARPPAGTRRPRHRGPRRRLPRNELHRARQRRLGVDVGLRLHRRLLRCDAGLRLRPGRRDAGVRRVARMERRPDRARLGPVELARPLDRRLQRRARGDPGAPGGRDRSGRRLRPAVVRGRGGWRRIHARLECVRDLDSDDGRVLLRVADRACREPRAVR